MANNERTSRFFTIKLPGGGFSGIFIAPDEETAREIAKKNDFKIDDTTEFIDISESDAGKKKGPFGGVVIS